MLRRTCHRTTMHRQQGHVEVALLLLLVMMMTALQAHQRLLLAMMMTALQAHQRQRGV